MTNWRRIRLAIAATSILLSPSCVALQMHAPVIEPTAPKTAEFVRSIESQRDVNPQRSFWSRLADFVAGPAPVNRIVRPYDVKTDSTGRVLVTDPGLPAVHVFDFKHKKYLRLNGSRQEHLQSPIGVAALIVSSLAVLGGFMFLRKRSHTSLPI